MIKELKTYIECPVCSEMAVEIKYDDEDNGGMDTYRCKNCGWC